MRWFFLVLLITNIGYVAWELNRERSHYSAPPALPKNVQRIMLLSELEPQPVRHDEPVRDDAERTALQQTTAPVLPAPVVPEEVAQQQAPGTEVTADGQATTEHGIEEQPMEADPAEQTDQAPVAVQVEKPAEDLCYTLGPFREMTTLRAMTREIKDYVIEASFRSKEEQEQSMFRVYLKPVRSKKEARALIKQLNSKNIRDHFIITEGPLKNGISLGYFSNKKRAHKHAGRVRKHGFDALIEPVFRSYTIYWLDYRIEAGNEIPQRIFDQHLDDAARRLSRSCG